MSFVHLHTYSAYSLLNSTIMPEKLIETAKKMDYQAIALTDRNVLYGAIPFYKTALKHGIKPIIGLTADVLSEESIEDHQAFPLIFLAKNNHGFSNLIKISSAIQTKSQEGIPLKWLKHYGKDVFVLSPGIEGEIEQYLLSGEVEKAKALAERYKDLFGADSFFFTLQSFSDPKHQQLTEKLVQLAKDLQIPLVASNKTCFLNKEDYVAWNTLRAIKANVLYDKVKQEKIETEFHLKPMNEMLASFKDFPEAIENTIRIAEQCRVELKFHQRLLPKYPLQGISADDYLTKVCLEGLKARQVDKQDVYLKRLQYELDVIKKMDFSDYFLIVWDYVKYAKENGILVGPGRGSAAGSLVSYVLGITDVDPIQYDLLFERFLNPERISMPDIDIDFPDNRRDEMIEYVAKKYGENHVAQILTFGTFQAKAALRDAGRVFGLENKELEQLSRAIPSKLGITLDQALKESAPLQEIVRNERFNKIFQIAKKIEGLPRHTSTHAAGVIISDRPLVEIIPLQRGTGNVMLTQYPMEIVEELGLLKMDFLGLRNLTLIDSVLKSVKYQQNKTIDLDNIPFNDKKTFQLLQKGITTGVFQLESSGIRDVLKQLKPTEFEDIVAVNALYRPGPMANIPVYIRRKHGLEPVTYPHPDLEGILKRTYGVIVYQEQIMQIASKMAGFTLGEADLLRRAVSKKKREVLDQERTHFVTGSVKKGYSEEIANKIYDLIVRFADYGFNRSHAVAYSVIAYRMAYLKAHYPLHFFSALLSSVLGNEEKISQYINELKQFGFSVRPPSINKSGFGFEVEDGGLRYSLLAIKGVGIQALKEILQVRKQGKFTDIFDFCIRVNLKTVNRKTIENLIYAGSFDEFGYDRAVLLATLDVAINHAQLIRPDGGQMDLLFGEATMLKPKYVEVEPIPIDKKLQYEKQVLGLFLSEHPASLYRDRFRAYGAILLDQLTQEKRLSKVGIYIMDVRKVRTKSGQAMAFLEISDESGEMDAVVFPNVYRNYLPQIKPGAVVMATGRMEYRNGKKQIIIESIKEASELVTPNSEIRCFIRITKERESKFFFNKIKEIVQESPGNTPLILFYERNNKTIQLTADYWVDIEGNAVNQLKEIFGEENVRIK